MQALKMLYGILVEIARHMFSRRSILVIYRVDAKASTTTTLAVRHANVEMIKSACMVPVLHAKELAEWFIVNDGRPDGERPYLH